MSNCASCLDLDRSRMDRSSNLGRNFSRFFHFISLLSACATSQKSSLRMVSQRLSLAKSNFRRWILQLQISIVTLTAFVIPASAIFFPNEACSMLSDDECKFFPRFVRRLPSKCPHSSERHAFSSYRKCCCLPQPMTN